MNNWSRQKNRVRGIFNYLKGNYIRVLMYHSIFDDCDDPCAVAIENFRVQMGWIRDNGYKVISLKQALESLGTNNIRRKSLVLTFDDGFMDFLENAAPVLDRHDFKATVFIVTSGVGSNSSWRPQGMNRRLMGWDALKGLLSAGYSIGSHGLHHYDLTKLRQDELDKETAYSRNVIRERLGVEADSFSYPWGRYTERGLDSVRRAGYKCAVTAASRWHNNPGTDRFLLQRVSIERKDPIHNFIKKLR